MTEIIFALIGGGAAVSVIEGVREWLRFRRERKAKIEDAENINFEERLKKVESAVGAVISGQKYILYDRIRYLGHAYISDGEIDFDDRRILNDMHGVYHNELGGNGDLDILMRDVNRLPLKKR